jgi:hypothetical protein
MESDFLTPQEAADYLRISASLLAKMRMDHYSRRGPVYVKMGGDVIYHLPDLKNWAMALRVTGDGPPALPCSLFAVRG